MSRPPLPRRICPILCIAVLAMASCGEKSSGGSKPSAPPPAATATKASDPAKNAAGQKPAPGQAAKKPGAAKPKEINLVALLKPNELKKSLGLAEDTKVGVNRKDLDKGIVRYVWLKPDHGEIQKKNEELLKKAAEKEAAGQTVAPADKKPTAKHYTIQVNYGKPFATPAAAGKSLETRRGNMAKKADGAQPPVAPEDVPGLGTGAFWRADTNTLVFAKGTRVVVLGVNGTTEPAKAKEWALALAKAVEPKLR